MFDSIPIDRVLTCLESDLVEMPRDGEPWIAAIGKSHDYGTVLAVTRRGNEWQAEVVLLQRQSGGWDDLLRGSFWIPSGEKSPAVPRVFGISGLDTIVDHGGEESVVPVHAVAGIAPDTRSIRVGASGGSHFRCFPPVGIFVAIVLGYGTFDLYEADSPASDLKVMSVEIE